MLLLSISNRNRPSISLFTLFSLLRNNHSFTTSSSLTNPDQNLSFSPNNEKPQNPRIPKLLNSHKNPKNLSYLDYTSLLQSCIEFQAIEPGKQLHAQLCASGLGFDTILATKLVDLYCICGDLFIAHLLFDRISKRNIFLWNVLIRAYAWTGPYEAAIHIYYRMLDFGLEPDKFTFPFVLKACSGMSSIEHGREIHEHVRKTRWESDVFVVAALIDMYAKCGCVEKAREVFDKTVERDVVIWNSMLSAYSQNGHPEDCLFLSTEMASLGGLRPMVVTLAADIAALPQGRELHGFSWWHGFEVQVKVKTALVDMYAKSGAMKVARNLFGRQMEKNILLKCDDYWVCDAWTCSEALRLFEEMKREALPDHIMVVGVLSACSHAGMVEEGQTYSDLMVGDYNITLTVPYYACWLIFWDIWVD